MNRSAREVKKCTRRFERYNGLDSALYKNYINFLYILNVTVAKVVAMWDDVVNIVNTTSPLNLCVVVVAGTPSYADGSLQRLHSRSAEQEGDPTCLWCVLKMCVRCS